MEDLWAKNKRNDITRPFQRVFSIPLDVSTIFDSEEDAEKYALGDGSDKRKLGKTAYLGQIISVVDAENATVKVFQITYGEGGNVAPYALAPIVAGGDGGSTSEVIVIDNVTIPAGSNLQEVILKLKEVIESKGEGETSDAIVVGGETIVQPGTDYTEALNAIAEYLNSVHEDIVLPDGTTLVEEGDSVTEALQAIVDEMANSGGVNSAKMNDVDIYDPDTKDISFVIDGADDDIDVTTADDLGEDEPVRAYVDLKGISNNTLVLPGSEVDYTVKIYERGTSNLLWTGNFVEFVTSEKTVAVDLESVQQGTYFDGDGTQLIPNGDGEYEFELSESQSGTEVVFNVFVVLD